MFRAEFSRNTFIVNFSASRARFLILPIVGYRFADKSYDQDTPFRASLPARGNGGPWPFRWFCSLPVIVRAAVARRLERGRNISGYLVREDTRRWSHVRKDPSSICFSTIMCYQRQHQQRQHQQQQQQHMGEKGGVIGALVGENSREKAWIIRE